MGDPSQRLIFLEPSKVRNYHATFVDGMIRAFISAGLAKRWGKLALHAHESFFAHLSEESRVGVDFRPVAVVDQGKRQLVRKTLLEAWNVLRCIARMKREDVLVVTTIMPSAMILVEIAKWFFPRKRLIAFVHGEIEGAFDPSRQRLGSYGFYILAWLRLRSFHTSAELAVIDTFIADDLIARFPKSIRPEHIHVVPHPMIAMSSARQVPNNGEVRCCFIGYNTPNKGYDTFERLAADNPVIDFRVIGAGVDHSLTHGTTTKFAGPEDFFEAIAACDVAVLPYVNGYDRSLSAAAVDAIAAGTHLLASDRGCFSALEREFGPESVTVCRDEAAMASRLKDKDWLRSISAGREARIARIERSHYGLIGVAKALEQLMLRGRAVRCDHANAARTSSHMRVSPLPKDMK